MKRATYFVVAIGLEDKDDIDLIIRTNSMKKAHSFYSYNAAIANMNRSRAISGETVHILKLVK